MRFINKAKEKYNKLKKIKPSKAKDWILEVNGEVVAEVDNVDLAGG